MLAKTSATPLKAENLETGTLAARRWFRNAALEYEATNTTSGFRSMMRSGVLSMRGMPCACAATLE